MPAHLIYGDSFLTSQELKSLGDGLDESTLMGSNFHRLAGNRVTLPELLDICNALPFLDPVRFVLVEGLLSVYERGAGTARGRGRRAAGGSSTGGGDWDALAAAIPQMPETTRLVFLDGPLSRSNPLLRSLSGACEVHAKEPPVREGLAVWIKNQAQEKGSGIAPAAVRLLADLVGNNLWSLDRELEKLSLFCGGRNIEESDVQEMVAQVREASIFNAVDAIIDGNAATASRLLRQLFRDGRDAGYIIGMVARQLRLVALAKSLSEGGVSPNEVGSRIGLTAQFPLRKTLEQARRHSWPTINRGYQRLLEADLAIKRGRQEPELALDLLVADLAGSNRG